MSQLLACLEAALSRWEGNLVGPAREQLWPDSLHLSSRGLEVVQEAGCSSTALCSIRPNDVPDCSSPLPGRHGTIMPSFQKCKLKSGGSGSF